MNLLRALATVSSMTMLSRILGFVRDFVIARTFGAGVATDAFFVAFKLPNLLRRMFAEGAFSQAFVPILGEYKNRQGPEAAHQLINRVAGTLGLCVLLLSIVGVLAAPWLVYVSAPGFSADAEKFELTVALTRLTFPYILFMSLVALAGGVLNTWGRFAIPAFTPVLLNLSFIALALLLAPRLAEPVMALGWAVILGGVAQLALQLPALAKVGLLPRPQLAWRDEGVRRVMRLMAPALLGVSVTQVSLLINTIFASFLATGSVSWLYYADRLMEFPVGLLGAALGTILLPTLSRLSAEARLDEYSQTLDWGLRLCLLLALPAALALAILSAPLIATLFYHGAFAANDVVQTQRALIAYSVGLTGLLLVKVLAPGFYARQNIRTPVKIALASLAVTQALNLALIVPLQHAGLALAIGLAACFNAGLLYHGLRRHGIYQPQAGWPAFLARLAAGLMAMGTALWFFSGNAESWLHYSSIERLWRLAALVIGGAAVYFGALRVVGIRLADFRRRADY